MKVKELITELQKFDPELVVCIGDWNELYAKAQEFEVIQVRENTRHWRLDKDEMSTEAYLQLGAGS